VDEKDAIRVVLVDDHHFFRQGLRSLLREHGFEIAGEATSGEAAIGLTLEVQPDVVVMDLHMPGISGVEATRRLSERGSSARILVLTVSTADADVVEAMVAGACGYLLKDTAPDQIAAGVRAAAAGESMLSASVAAQLVDRARDVPPAPQDAVDLSEREIEVLRLICAGRSDQQIADELVVSVDAVKSTLRALFEVFGVDALPQNQKRASLALQALRTGVITRRDL
jgi:NarL family two-component system response regulator LiaR